MTSWHLTNLALCSLGLKLRETQKVKTERVALRLTSFQLPDSGRECFRRLQGGCWYAGFPSTGPARQILRAVGVTDESGALVGLGEEAEKMKDGYWAIEASEGRLQRVRLWWMDHGSPRAIRVVGLVRSGVNPCLKVC